MTFKLELKQTSYKVDTGEPFGIFSVRPLGAGEQLEMSRIQRNIYNINERIQKLSELTTKTEATKEEIDEAQKEIESLSEEIYEDSRTLSEILKSQITSAKRGMVDKLFNTVEIAEIRRLIDGTLEHGRETETNRQA